MASMTARILWLLLLGCASSQAAFVTAQIGSSTLVLEPFHEFNLPPDPTIGMQVTELFGANVVQTNHFVTMGYDSDFYSVQTSSNYHSEMATVGTRTHEYVGFFDPETNELQSATWQVIAEDLLEVNFQVGASSVFLQLMGGGNPDDPPPPPPQIMPLPSTAIMLGSALMLCLARQRRYARS